MIGKIFCKRRVLVITDDNIKNYPLTAKSQALIFLGFFGFISWVSFSSGKYFTFKQVINQKEAEVYQANLINLDLQTKIDNLQSNLVKLNEYFSTVKEFDYNQDGKSKKKSRKSDKSQEVSYIIKDIADPFGAKNISKRHSFKVKQQVVDNINSNATNRIKGIKNLIAITGLSVSDVEVDNNAQTKEIVEKVFSFTNQGGPNTENITPIDYQVENIDDDIQFAENIEQLMYLENFFNSLPFGTPMRRYYISSRYGKRVDPMTRRRANHFGTDFAGPIGAKIYTTAPGIVKFSGRKGNYGKFVEIDHGFGIVTRYGHLSRLKVKKGEKVERGQVIAHQGSTGRSSGPHLHYEVRFKDKHFNPEKFIKAGQYVF